MQRTAFGDMTCSIARAEGILGDSWTPLILRDLLVGFTQFDEIHQDLGIATKCSLTASIGWSSMGWL